MWVYLKKNARPEIIRKECNNLKHSLKCRALGLLSYARHSSPPRQQHQIRQWIPMRRGGRSRLKNWHTKVEFIILAHWYKDGDPFPLEDRRWGMGEPVTSKGTNGYCEHQICRNATAYNPATSWVTICNWITNKQTKKSAQEIRSHFRTKATHHIHREKIENVMA